MNTKHDGARPVEATNRQQAPTGGGGGSNNNNSGGSSSSSATNMSSSSGSKTRVSLTSVSTKTGNGTASIVGYDPAVSEELRSSLLSLWDELGTTRWGAGTRKFQRVRVYTMEEIKGFAERARGGTVIRSAGESGVAVDPVPLSVTIPSSPASGGGASSASGAGAVGGSAEPPRGATPAGPFNPFSPLAGDQGTTPGVFDPTFSAPPGSVESTAASPAGVVPGMDPSLDSEKRFQCTICGKGFKTQLGLTGHYETKHPGQASAVASAGSTASGSKADTPRPTIGINLENIPAYVPTPVDMSKVPGQGASEGDPRAALLAEELKNANVSLEQDVVVHARSYTNITLSGVVCELASGYQGMTPVTQFSLVVDVAEAGVPPECVTIRVYGSTLSKRAQATLREGNLVMVIGLLRLNPVALGSRFYNNPFITVADSGGAVLPLA